MRMHSGALLATLLIPPAVSFNGPPDRPVIDYRFRLEHAADGTPVLDVQLTATGSPDGETRFNVPSIWAGEDSLRSGIVLLEAKGLAAITGDSGGVIVVHHEPGALVTIHYVLRQDWTGPIRYPHYHRVILDSSYVMFNGQNGMVSPAYRLDGPVDVRFTWEGVPPAWRIVTSFGSGTRTTARTTPRALLNASFVAGHLRVLDTRRGDRKLTVMTDGHWRFSDDAYATLQEAVWSREREFWNDDPFDHGFIVLIPAIQHGTVGGTALTGGFVEFADTASDLTTVVRVATHEMLHFWNGQRMRSPDPEGLYKWFTEGFTDYYADRFLHAAGGTSDDGYLAQVNRSLREYYTSPAAGSTRVAVEARYWTDADMKVYPYRQGYVFALWLESELSRASSGKFGLDALMHRMYRAVTRSGGVISDTMLLAQVPAKYRDRIARSIAASIDRGEPVPPPAGALGACATLASTDIYHFDLGFDVSATTRDKTARGVTPGGPAARAGLQDGMKLTGWGWYNGDPDREVTLRTTDGVAQRELTYLPRSGAPTPVPQFIRDTTRHSCRS
jgi:predicted metalloprotease with PDZ domain